MNKRLLLTLAMSTSAAMFSGAYAADTGVPVSGRVTGSQLDAFAILDQNNDAYIERNEIARDSTLARDFARFDADGDGRLSLTEFSIYAGGSAVGAPAGGEERLGPGSANGGVEEGVTPEQAGPTQSPRGVDPGISGSPPAGSTNEPGGTFGP